MNNDIFPCLWFDNNGKEAADFYVNVFNGKVTVDTPMVQNIEIFGQKVMHLTAGPTFQKNASISLMVICFSEEEIQKYWNELSDGGIALMPLDTYPFAKKYGWVRDKFGTTWQLYFGDVPEDSQRLVPNLMFINQNNGKARKAMEFYTDVFPNSRIDEVLTYANGGEKGEAPENIQHGEFIISDYRFGCLDSSLEHQFNFTEGISIVVLTENESETDYLWNSLISNGGEESRCGWLKDQFGVSWQIVPKLFLELMNDSSDPMKQQKVMQAMMTMTKIDIKEIEKASQS